jgi:hypothetical protein
MSQAASEVRWRGLGASGPVRGEAAQSAQLRRYMAVYYNECRNSETAERIILSRKQDGGREKQNY